MSILGALIFIKPWKSPCSYLHDHTAQQAANNVAAANVGGSDAVRDEIRHGPSVVPNDLEDYEFTDTVRGGSTKGQQDEKNKKTEKQDALFQ